MSFLERVLEETRQRIEAEKRAIPPARLREQALEMPTPASLKAALLAAESPAIIAEIKRCSPSRGALAPDVRVGNIAGCYERGGAAALSVLTEPSFFGGSLEDLQTARSACCLPLLRKDFIVDDYQALQARAAGASAVLLICAALPGASLGEIMGAAHSLGLECLVEVHDLAEMERALAVGANLVGINNRDLKSLQINLDTSRRLLPLVPPGVAGVSESGIGARSEVEEMGRCGATAVLIGSSLVQAVSPEAAVRELAGRAAS